MPFDDILNRHQDLNKQTYQFEILVRGADLSASSEKVLSFFRKYQLVRFSHISVQEERSVSAAHPDFSRRLEESLTENWRILGNLIRELQDERIVTLEDLKSIPQGYRTKLLHVITHFLDGFFGIDTFFYNLIEDSHWVSDTVRAQLEENPSDFWIVALNARI